MYFLVRKYLRMAYGLLPCLKETLRSMVMQYVDAIRMTADEREIKMVEKTVDLLYESSAVFQGGDPDRKIHETGKT